MSQRLTLALTLPYVRASCTGTKPYMFLDNPCSWHGLMAGYTADSFSSFRTPAHVFFFPLQSYYALSLCPIRSARFQLISSSSPISLVRYDWAAHRKARLKSLTLFSIHTSVTNSLPVHTYPLLVIEDLFNHWRNDTLKPTLSTDDYLGKSKRYTLLL